MYIHATLLDTSEAYEGSFWMFKNSFLELTLHVAGIPSYQSLAVQRYRKVVKITV